jgi:hypothetical protein
MTTATPTPSPPRGSRLAGVRSGRLKRPKRILLYGVEKIGKSTFASEAPWPIFIGPEDGTAELDVKRFPQAETWADVTADITDLITEDHQHQTLVIDTLDWIEPLNWAFVCRRDKKSDIEAYGYGKGYLAALDEWRSLLALCDRLRNTRSMDVILLAHSWIKSFKNPAGEDYDRYELKLHGKASGLIKEWCDAVLFAHYDEHAVKAEGQRKAKGVESAPGVRMVHTQRRAAWDAGNRLGLPLEFPLSWEEFAAHCEAGVPADAATLLTAINTLLVNVDEKTRETTTAWLADSNNSSDASKLARLADKLRGKQVNS